MIDTDEGALGMLFAHAVAMSDRRALTVGDTQLTWGDLGEAVARFASGIEKAGVAKGNRIAILAGNSAEAVIAYLGSIAAGCVAVPLPSTLLGKDLGTLIEDSAPALVVADEAGADAIAGLSDAALVRVGGEATAEGSFDDFLRRGDPEGLPAKMAREADFNIIYSSGTTGRPKGIVHAHGMRNRQASRRIFGIDPESVMLLATPLYSNTTLMPMLASLYHGGHVVLMEKFDVARYLNLAATHRATHTMLVPVQYQRLMAYPGFADFDLSSFKVKQSTSAPMADPLKRDILARWPGRFVEVYGLTEGGVTLILDAGRYPDKLHTVGQPAPGNEIRVIDDTGRELTRGKTGEVVGRSPFMMKGYWQRPDADAALEWRAPDGSVFFKSGDLGAFDEDGFLTLHGRKKDLIISGGFNIYPSDLESVLLTHPDVAEVAVVGAESERWGETPFAFVVPHTGRQIDADALRGWANARLGRIQRLAGISIRAELPRSSIGKVLKTKLAADPALKEVR